MTKKEPEHRRQTVLDLLDGVVHPESGRGLATGGFVEEVAVSPEGIAVGLKFARARDPFAASLRRQSAAVLSEAFPAEKISVEIKPVETTAAEHSKRLPGVDRVVAVASGKGGVGKSTVAAHLARTLAAEGYRVGLLDADIYGPSQPALFEVEDYLPVAAGCEVAEGSATAAILPAENHGVKIMSIGFFISPSDALVWRGPMATNALRQLIRQTAWGPLDYLIVDLPPGTGDVLLSVVQELELDGAIIVSTPQGLSVADVRRGVEMFRAEGVGVPVLGLVENMAWFSPPELPGSRYYIFGQGGARALADELGIDFLGEIPITTAAQTADPPQECVDIAHRIVEKLSAGC